MFDSLCAEGKWSSGRLTFSVYQHLVGLLQGNMNMKHGEDGLARHTCLKTAAQLLLDGYTCTKFLKSMNFS